MNIQETVLNILEDITGTDEVVNNQDIQLFEEGLLDSLATVQLLVEIEGQLGIQVPVSDFDREVWGTPKQIIQQVEALQVDLVLSTLVCSLKSINGTTDRFY